MEKVRLFLAQWWWFIPLVVGPFILWWWADSADDFGLLVLVWLWTIGSAIGLIASVLLAFTTWHEFEALSQKRRNDRVLTLIAEANFRREIFRVVEFLCLLIIGASVLFGKTNILLSRVMIVLVVALVFGNVVLDWYERRRSHGFLLEAALGDLRDKTHEDECA